MSTMNLAPLQRRRFRAGLIGISRRRLLIYAGLTWWFCWWAGCSSTTSVRRKDRPPGSRIVFSLQELSCQSCGTRAVRVLRQRPGIYHASFDRKKVELAIAYDPRRADPLSLQKTIAQLGFRCVRGPGKGSYSPAPKFAPGMDVKIISRRGEDVDLRAHLVPGKITVFDFFAIWCGPCKDIDRALIAMMRKYHDIAVRKLNVIDWRRPIAKRYLSRVPALPYLIVYSPSGKRIAAISGRKLDRLRAAIQRARKTK